MKQIDAIQVLRALAALMIVLSHAQNDVLREAVMNGLTFTRFELLPWDSGVDLFFVISGFIMVYSSQRLFATSGAAGTFIGRRVIRIVPLYWIITAIALLMLGYVAFVEQKHPFPSISEIAASLGFFPFARPIDGQPRPIVDLGWTLNYEMFFYVVFAIFISFRRDVAIAAVALSLACGICLGAFFHPKAVALAYWSDPIVFEFVLGMLVARIWLSGFRLKRWMVLLFVVAGMSVLFRDLDGMTTIGALNSDPNGFMRLFGAGLPMLAVFAAIVLAEPAFMTRTRLGRFFALLGNASYALYLFHPLAIIFDRKAYLAFGLEKAAGFWPLIAAEVVMAIGLALIVHLFIEKPISVRLHGWFVNKRPKVQRRVPKQPPKIGEIPL